MFQHFNNLAKNVNFYALNVALHVVSSALFLNVGYAKRHIREINIQQMILSFTFKLKYVSYVATYNYVSNVTNNRLSCSRFRKNIM